MLAKTVNFCIISVDRGFYFDKLKYGKKTVNLRQLHHKWNVRDGVCLLWSEFCDHLSTVAQTQTESKAQSKRHLIVRLRGDKGLDGRRPETAEAVETYDSQIRRTYSRRVSNGGIFPINYSQVPL